MRQSVLVILSGRFNRKRGLFVKSNLQSLLARNQTAILPQDNFYYQCPLLMHRTPSLLSLTSLPTILSLIQLHISWGAACMYISMLNFLAICKVFLWQDFLMPLRDRLQHRRRRLRNASARTKDNRTSLCGCHWSMMLPICWQITVLTHIFPF